MVSVRAALSAGLGWLDGWLALGRRDVWQCDLEERCVTVEVG